MEILRQINYERASVVGGYTDRILRIDLGTREIVIQELPPDFRDKYVGGRGYALKMIWDGTTRGTHYDSPENIAGWFPIWLAQLSMPIGFLILALVMLFKSSLSMGTKIWVLFAAILIVKFKLGYL